MTDQHRVDTLGAYGNTARARRRPSTSWRAPAPASTGWYTPTAICTPARASLLTGQAPFRHKVLANHERNVGYIEDLPDGHVHLRRRRCREQGYNMRPGRQVARRHRAEGRADFGFDGPDLPGWHNPVDHPDYLALPDASTACRRTRSAIAIRGTLPNGGPGNLLAARLHQPVEATFEHYLATRAIELLRAVRRGRGAGGSRSSSALHFFGPHLPYIVPDAYFDMYRPGAGRAARSRSPRPSRASRRCSATTARTGPSTPCRSRSPASSSPSTGATSR